MSNWLEALLGRVQNAGVNIALGHGLNFMSGLRARFNSTTKYIDVDVDLAVAPEDVQAESEDHGGFIVPIIFRVEFTTGGLEEIQILDSAPFALRVLMCVVQVDTVGNGSGEIASEANGTGDVLFTGIPLGDTVGKKINDGGEVTIPEGGELWFGRSATDSAGVIYLYCQRIEDEA